MITVDINGNTLTSAYDDAIRADSRTMMARVLREGVELEGGINRIEVIKGSCADTEFNLGGVISYSLTLEVMGLMDNIRKGQVLEAQIGVLTDEENETYTYIKIGEFIVSEVKKAVYSATVTAHGRLVANSGRLLDPISGIITDTGEQILTSDGELIAYPPIIESQSLAALGTKVAMRLGCPVRFDAGIDTSLTVDKALTGLTVYQVIQVMASVIGGYAMDTADGAVIFKRFSNTPTLSVDSGMMTKLPQVAESDYTITGIRCVVSEASSTDAGDISAVAYSIGSPVSLSISNEYMTAQLFADMGYLVGYSYRPGSILLSLGDPRLEGDDVLEVTDADGAIYTVPCHQLHHTYDGGFFSGIEAARATNIASGIGSMTPFQSLKKETRANFVAVKETVEAVKHITDNTAQHFWMTEEGTDTGAHITEKTQEEFLADPTNGGGNILIRSNGFAVREGLDELASFGADGTLIGKANQSHQEMNYHAMKLIDGEGNEYLHFSDLRDAEGKYQATESFTGDGTTTLFRLSFGDITASVVTVDGIETQAYDLISSSGYIWVEMETAPSAGATVVVIYQTESAELKAYTLGTRTGSIGAYSVAEGLENEASGKYSHAHGTYLKATEEQFVIGRLNKQSDKAFILGNGGNGVRSNAMTVDWDGHIRQQSAGAGISDLGADAIGFINALTAKKFDRGIGFTASEVEAADAWNCLVDGDTVDYISIIAALVTYCQDLETRLSALEA